MDEEKIDLSPLDPSRNEQRWNRSADSIATRAWKAAKRVSFRRQLIAWARPAIAFAIVIAVMSVTGAYFFGHKNITQGVENMEPAMALVSWAAGDPAPSAAAILEVLGGNHGAK